MEDNWEAFLVTYIKISQELKIIATQLALSEQVVKAHFPKVKLLCQQLQEIGAELEIPADYISFDEPFFSP